MAEVGEGVLFLTDRLGGPDEVRALRGLVERLGRLGHAPRVLCRVATPDHGIAGLTELPGLGRRWLLPWASRGLGLGESPGRPRVLHVLGAGMAEAGLEVAERWRLPYLITIDEYPRRDARLRLSRSWCRGLTATGDELAGALAGDFGIPARLIRVVPRGIAGPAKVPGATSSGRVPVVGAAGPLVAGSGFVTFLNAARKVVDAGIDVEFLIAGGGDGEADLRRRAERLRITDRLTFSDALAVGLTFWDALDVFCQTSVTATTGRPLALAMAHGVPSVTSDVEGLRALVRDGETGVRVPAGDASALARAIIGLLADRDRARAIGRAGRATALAGHDPDREAGRLDGLYREAAAGAPAQSLRGSGAGAAEGRTLGWASAPTLLGPES